MKEQIPGGSPIAAQGDWRSVWEAGSCCRSVSRGVTSWRVKALWKGWRLRDQLPLSRWELVRPAQSYFSGIITGVDDLLVVAGREREREGSEWRPPVAGGLGSWTREWRELGFEAPGRPLWGGAQQVEGVWSLREKNNREMENQESFMGSDWKKQIP